MNNITYISVVIFLGIILTSCDYGSDPKDGLSYEEYLKKAQQYTISNDNEKAISAYKKALKIKPDDAETHYALGRIYDSEEQRSYAETHNKYQYDILTNPNKKRNKDHIKDLETYGYKSNYKTFAFNEYKQAIKYDPKQWAASVSFPVK